MFWATKRAPPPKHHESLEKNGSKEAGTPWASGRPKASANTHCQEKNPGPHEEGSESSDADFWEGGDICRCSRQVAQTKPSRSPNTRKTGNVSVRGKCRSAANPKAPRAKTPRANSKPMADQRKPPDRGSRAGGPGESWGSSRILSA